MLMAADILLYDAEIIPVGKDQEQHIEMTRDVASRFHAKMGGETFVLPKADIQKDTMLIPGTDGSKMSKSKGNIIDIFLPEKKLRKQIMSIATDSTPLEEPKDWSTCNCFALYNLLASDVQIAEMKTNYERGNYGYGHAKQALYKLMLERFSEPRERYDYYMNNLNEVDAALAIGASKAKVVADSVLKRVRKKIGY
jgi:tryptophanyl-tRNA synthetase